MSNSLSGSFFILSIIMVLFFSACKNDDYSPDDEIKEEEQPLVFNNEIIESDQGEFTAISAAEKISIDGQANEITWFAQPWKSMNYKWMGSEVDSSDYFGRFKLAWDSAHLYILFEVTDETLHPTLQDGVDNYWKGDYVEVFIDEDQSGGDHKFNHQAFAYHISTEGHAIDKNTAKETVFFDDHIDVSRTENGNTYLWEIALRLYDDSFDENGENTPVELLKGKKIGFSIAYGDNDGKQQRENFMGSKSSHGINNDEGYTNSSVFGTLEFVE
ncbi:MAG: sugar-binding protein [Bacteroidia bacterium]